MYGPHTSAATVNDTIAEMWQARGGGWIILTGPQTPERPYVLAPGVKLWAGSMPMLYDKTWTRVTPQYSNDAVFVIDDGKPDKRQPWGASQLDGFQIDAQTPGLTAVSLIGGNGSEVNNVTSTHGKYPLEYGLLVDQGRPHDGQYSTFNRLRFTRVKHAFSMLKSAPDCSLVDSMGYCGDITGSTGLDIRSGSNNWTIDRLSCQFVDMGYTIDSKENLITGGQWENRSGQPQWASYAFKVGPSCRDLTVRSMSFANLSSIDRVFVLDAAARDYTFEYLSGHVQARDVPPGGDPHFVWHQA